MAFRPGLTNSGPPRVTTPIHFHPLWRISVEMYPYLAEDKFLARVYTYLTNEPNLRDDNRAFDRAGSKIQIGPKLAGAPGVAQAT